MKWKLFLDDQTFDPDATERVRIPEGFTPALSSAEAISLVEKWGLPEFMMLDFDLSGEDKASTFLKRLYSLYPDGPIPEYSIHSKNGQGSLWMESYLDSWKRSLEK